MSLELFDRKIAPVYNQLIIEATDAYLAPPAPRVMKKEDRAIWRAEHPIPDTASMSDAEFLYYSLEASRQPLNPITLAREAFKENNFTNVDEMSDLDISHALREEYLRVEALYKEHGINPEPLKIAWEIIHKTEAYIAGYSRQIDRLAVRLKNYTPQNAPRPYNGLDRWHNGLWVPDEDMHDRIETFILLSTGIIDQEDFYHDHSRHMKIGNHVDTSDFMGSNAFVALQEDATVITYENAARIYGPILGRIIHEIAKNEAHHKRAYKQIHLGLTREFPDEAVLTTLKVSDEFDMPGREGIEDYDNKAIAMGFIGLLDAEATLKSQQRLISAMNLGNLTLKTEKAKRARDALLEGKNVGQRKLKIFAGKLKRAREQALEQANKSDLSVPLIVGVTVASPIDESGLGDLEFLGIAA
ncbi:acyl-ACP desaturase [Candidatus Saccharibacteria bacterium]|nr:acyl-ACP desaturase [Candidatus Saccharibacteria bacterium]MCA9328785.1 acyl-ACP desaturase [Candidatus Saccharibacteria bacterium]